jgi:hypothetical protein
MAQVLLLDCAGDAVSWWRHPALMPGAFRPQDPRRRCSGCHAGATRRSRTPGLRLCKEGGKQDLDAHPA